MTISRRSLLAASVCAPFAPAQPSALVGNYKIISRTTYDSYNTSGVKFTGWVKYDRPGASIGVTAPMHAAAVATCARMMLAQTEWSRAACSVEEQALNGVVDIDEQERIHAEWMKWQFRVHDEAKALNMKEGNNK